VDIAQLENNISKISYVNFNQTDFEKLLKNYEEKIDYKLDMPEDLESPF
jgi:hypothetical protein